VLSTILPAFNFWGLIPGGSKNHKACGWKELLNELFGDEGGCALKSAGMDYDLISCQFSREKVD
jgi:hypothetical protein